MKCYDCTKGLFGPKKCASPGGCPNEAASGKYYCGYEHVGCPCGASIPLPRDSNEWSTAVCHNCGRNPILA